MRWFARTETIAICGIGLLIGVIVLAFGEKPGRADPPTEAAGATNPSPAIVSARERAQTMHQVYAATLEAMHEHYFHGERAIVPARALEDVFAEIARQSKIEARWISVNTKPMSIGHEPKGDFELQAAAALSKGDKHFERVDDEVYQRAGVIELSEGCVACHTGFFAAPPKTPRFAGLVIRVPLKRD